MLLRGASFGWGEIFEAVVMKRGQGKGSLLLECNWEVDNWEGYNSLAIAWRVELSHIVVELACMPLAFFFLGHLSKVPCLSTLYLLVAAVCFAAFLGSGCHDSLELGLNDVKFGLDIWVYKALHANFVWLSNQIDWLGSLTLLASACRRAGFVVHGNISKADEIRFRNTERSHINACGIGTQRCLILSGGRLRQFLLHLSHLNKSLLLLSLARLLLLALLRSHGHFEVLVSLVQGPALIKVLVDLLVYSVEVLLASR